MNSVITIFTVILLISASALCIALIVFLRRVATSINEFNHDTKQLIERIDPLVDSLVEMSASLKELSAEVSEQLDKTGWIVDEVKMRLESIISIEGKIKESVESPIDKLMSNLKAIRSALSVFWKTFNSGR